MSDELLLIYKLASLCLILKKGPDDNGMVDKIHNSFFLFFFLTFVKVVRWFKINELIRKALIVTNQLTPSFMFTHCWL